ncbi:stage V sporulation protein AC [Bacillus carboniphilus]|uniref:Stage V sporulation protein AC n=1 Tax=Bacillus carboniphilus TaxID=86663 RepID=A0ABY9JZC1_9BACI|nr:stage V sporulation protein AC [Bacillus carboniphilus]WLR43800.1 stage V sporulation protein AC [Bacillus carboniphilus]
MVEKKIKDDYKENVKKYHPKTPYFFNCLKAFLVGGVICAFGQVISNLYENVLNLSEETASSSTVATLILISAILTGLGVYDKIGQFAGAGSAIPVTGFANSMTSAALEHRSEGLVFGVATNMFKLAGSVIVFGTVAAYVVGMIRFLLLQTYTG